MGRSASSSALAGCKVTLIVRLRTWHAVPKTHPAVVAKAESVLSAVPCVRFRPLWVRGYGKVTAIVLKPQSLGLARSPQLCTEGPSMASAPGIAAPLTRQGHRMNA